MDNTTVESRILEAAREIFVRDGFGGARMQIIADRAGVNKALLHYYFRSKEKLYDAIFAGHNADLSQAFAALNDASFTIPEKLSAFCVQMVDLARTRRSEFQLLLNQWELASYSATSNSDSEVGPFANLHIVAQLEEGQRLGLLRAGNPRPLVAMLLAMALFPILKHGLFSQVVTPHPDDAEADVFLRTYYEQLPAWFMSVVRA